MNNKIEEYLEFANDIAKYAGEVMLKYFQESNGSSYKGDKTIVTMIGVVFDPFTNNLYSAIKGKGALKNGKEIVVNNYKFEDMRTVCHYDSWPSADYDISKKIN